MAAKRFHVARPDELRALNNFVKEGKLSSMVTVWTAQSRRTGETRWDNAIYVGFSGDRNRDASVIRIGANGELVFCARLHYNLALNWCKQHLHPVYD